MDRKLLIAMCIVFALQGVMSFLHFGCMVYLEHTIPACSSFAAGLISVVTSFCFGYKVRNEKK